MTDADADNYWVPITKGKTKPGHKLTRDGGRWVSAGVDLETEVEITFDGHSSGVCLTNSTFHMIPAGIATVETTVISTTTAQFRIKGMAAGEATLVVRCSGVDRGWFHVACMVTQTVTVRTGVILTDWTRDVGHSASGLDAYLNKVYRQAVMEITVEDMGVIDLRGNAALNAVERPFYRKNVIGNGVNLDSAFIVTDGFAEVFTPVLQAALPAAAADTFNLFKYVPKGAACAECERLGSRHWATMGILLQRICIRR